MKKILAYKKQNIAKIEADNILKLAKCRAEEKATITTNEATAYANS
jgi:hypothetical protein